MGSIGVLAKFLHHPRGAGADMYLDFVICAFFGFRLDEYTGCLLDIRVFDFPSVPIMK
jgi:hypothetical protein